MRDAPAQPRATSGLARAWPALGLIAVLLCAGLSLSGPWPEEEASASGPKPTFEPTPQGAGFTQGLPRDATVSAQRAASAVASTAAPAVAVLARVREAGERARRLAPAPEQAVSAEALQARLAQNPAVVAATTAGTRVRVQGRLEGVERGEAGVVVVRLALPGRAQGLRLVASPDWAERAAAWAAVDEGASMPSLSLDCLSQGVLMGEWLLVDCQG